jgi:hypothetical protein
MKDDMKVKVPNGTSKILIPSDGVVNGDGVLKSSGRPCNTFFKLDRKIYRMKFDLKMLIGK